MTGPGARSQRLALAGLLIMVALLLAPEPTAWSAAVALPLLVLALTGLRPARKWGGWVAAVMVPYFCVALGEAIANPVDRLAAGALSACAAMVFIAAFDSLRRAGVSLRS